MDKRIVLLIAIVCIASVSGQLKVDVGIIDNSIYLDELAKYSISVTNPDRVAKTVRIYSPDIEWHVENEPSIAIIPSGETVSAELRILPSSMWVSPGAYIAHVVVESIATDELISINIPIYIKSYDSAVRQYVPSVELRVSFPEEIDPREDNHILVHLVNRNRLNIEELEIHVTSRLFKEVRVVPLEPYPTGERRENILFRIDPLTAPTEDILEVSLRTGNRTFSREIRTYKIVSYADFVQKEDTIQELFKKSSEYIIVNEGNVEKEDVIRLPTSLFKTVFTNTIPKPDKVSLTRNGYMEWSFDLRPMEEKKITVVENYRPIIYLLLLSIVISMVYYLYRSPVMLRKESIIIGSSKEGISEMKVLLHIRNRSPELIESIKVTDHVPSIAEVLKESHIGTIAPSKIIKHERKGTIVKWELETLEPFEERIVSYRLKSKIAILGGLTLPPSKIKFDTKKGKERVIKSNSSQVSMGL
jgi:hypothetical protein